jgi:DNA repair protein RadC
LKLGTRDFESFCIIFLDNRNRVIEFVELFRGTIDGRRYILAKSSERRCGVMPRR